MNNGLDRWDSIRGGQEMDISSVCWTGGDRATIETVKRGISAVNVGLVETMRQQQRRSKEGYLQRMLDRWGEMGQQQRRSRVGYL
ncbi:hypothetical protein DPMN_084220 [Dreissena polymorpha]|uniref:Uncharacterized protein n=1 Tax=Dreissena polymorpha TaxID=45954 RepID=A0A9D4BJ66_DREPO|nr:hypothetical protein DPMN_084220 [Dreissena polymorpha]